MARGAQDRRGCVEDYCSIVEDVCEEAEGFGFGEEAGAQEVSGDDCWKNRSVIYGVGVQRANELVSLLKTSCATVSRTAFVAVALASPTPKPIAD